MSSNLVNAWWYGEDYHAHVVVSPGICENWWSDDGIAWYDSMGEFVKTDAFLNSVIVFRGGPRSTEKHSITQRVLGQVASMRSESQSQGASHFDPFFTDVEAICELVDQLTNAKK